MRRKERRITDRKEIDTIIHASEVCRLAMARDNQPYLVPLSFGYDGAAIYLHTAGDGRKIDFFKANNRVCFEFEHGIQLVSSDHKACKWSFRFQSVIGEGTIGELTENDEKTYGLNQIMRHYSDKAWAFEEKILSKTRVWKITIHTISGKQSTG